MAVCLTRAPWLYSRKRTADIVCAENGIFIEIPINVMRQLLANDSQFMCNFVNFAEGQLHEACSNKSAQVLLLPILLLPPLAV